jgi:hypothetical protein
MRIHGIQLRGLTAPAGDHQLGLDPGYTVLRLSDPDSARRFVALTRALLHPESERAAQIDARGRAVLTLALRSDACLIAADFARGRVSLGRHEVRGDGYKALSSDAHEIEEYLLAIGVPPAEDFDKLHVFGAGPTTPLGGNGDALLPARRTPLPIPPVVRVPDARAERQARAAEEHARRMAEHAAQVLELSRERERREQALEQALQAAATERARGDAQMRELRMLEDELAGLERTYEVTRAELEKSAPLADAIDDFDGRLTHFRQLAGERDEERAVIEDQRLDLLAERARLRHAPRRQLLPIGLGLALGAAGAGAGMVGYAIGYALAGAGILALLIALASTRLTRMRLGRVETLLATLRVRERTSERRFETEGAQIRTIMLALGVESLDALAVAGHAYANLLERGEAEKRRIAEFALRYPPEAREEFGRLEQLRRDGEVSEAVKAARAALLELPDEVPPLPEVPEATELDEADTGTVPPLEAETAVDLDEKPDEEVETVDTASGPETLVASAARVLGRSESEVRARLGPVLPIYLRAISAGTFTNARAVDGGSWVLRGAGREEVAFAALPDQERALVRLAVQLSLLEALASDRRVPLIIGPDLPARGETQQRALARAFKRLASVVQVIQVVTASEPWAEHAGKTLEI